MIGAIGGRRSHREVLPEGEMFVARVPLDKESSILGSILAQARAVEQFTLPKDEELLREMPTIGRHYALKSYCLRRALIEQVLFSRLSFTHRLPSDFEKKVAEEKKAREAAEKRVEALEVEMSRRDGKWRWELEMRDDQVKGLQSHRSKQSAVIAELKNKLGRLEKEVAERDARIKYLGEEVDLEKRHRLEAQEEARTERLAADHARLDFKEERVAHEATQATVQALEARIASLDSEAYKTKVIEEYRHSPLGKVEVALACKAGFNYLTSLLPPRF